MQILHALYRCSFGSLVSQLGEIKLGDNCCFVKLVMTVNGRHSPTATELLVEGLDTTWKSHIAKDIPHLISNIFLLIECLRSSASRNAGSSQNLVISMTIQVTLTRILLPSLALVDVFGYFHVVENKIWTTSSNSPIHLASHNGSLLGHM